jgi:hypothetical protein
MAAQVLSAARSTLNDFWPLIEFWEDKVKRHMRIVHDFFNPVVKAALDKKSLSKEAPPEDHENVTLLDDLVNQIDGMHFVFFSIRYLNVGCQIL